MAKTWIAHNGQFHEVSRLWVAQNGQFHEVTNAHVANNGQFHDSGAGDVAQLQSFYLQKQGAGYFSVAATWSFNAKNFDAGAGDRVYFTMESAAGHRVTSVEQQSAAGTTELPLGVPSTDWKVHIWMRYNGTDKFYGTVPIKTDPVPAPGDLQAYQAMDGDLVLVTLDWASVPYATGYRLTYYVNSSKQEHVWSQAAQPTARQQRQLVNLHPNTAFGAYVRTQVDDGATNWESDWSYINGRTLKGYTGGVIEVPAQQKRTLIMGDKSTNRRWRPANNEQLFHGHGGSWNEHGTQVGFIFYWPNNTTNPFDEVGRLLNKGAKCTRLQIRLNRSAVGHNRPIKPLVRTHKYKDWPGDQNLNGYMHENWERSPDAINFNERRWVDIDPEKAKILARDTGNGIALGSTAGKQEDYMAFWKEDTGKLRFTME